MSCKCCQQAEHLKRNQKNIPALTKNDNLRHLVLASNLKVCNKILQVMAKLTE